MAEVKRKVRDVCSEGEWEDRRSSPRLPPSAIPALKGVRLVAGPEVRLINVSRGGALLETEARLNPGSAINLRLVAADAVYLLRGKVLRSQASSLRGSVLLYQSAVSFDEDLTLIEDTGGNEAEDSSRRDRKSQSDKEADEGRPDRPPDPSFKKAGRHPEVLTVTASVPQSGPDLRPIFGLNDW